MRERYGTLCLLVALGLSACESSAGPTGGEEEEIWVLRTVAGSELPALVSDWSNLVVLSDTLTFGLELPKLYRGPLAHSNRQLGVPGGPPSEASFLFHLEREGSDVTLRSACPLDADCIALGLRGEMAGKTMTLSYTPSGSVPSFRSPLVYERVR
jgi:hypothetical protein